MESTGVPNVLYTVFLPLDINTITTYLMLNYHHSVIYDIVLVYICIIWGLLFTLSNQTQCGPEACWGLLEQVLSELQ
jgi:hypothetical protein